MQIIKFHLELTDHLGCGPCNLYFSQPLQGMGCFTEVCILLIWTILIPKPQTHLVWLNTFRNKCFGSSRVKQFTSPCKFSSKFPLGMLICCDLFGVISFSFSKPPNFRLFLFPADTFMLSERCCLSVRAWALACLNMYMLSFSSICIASFNIQEVFPYNFAPSKSDADQFSSHHHDMV